MLEFGTQILIELVDPLKWIPCIIVVLISKKQLISIFVGILFGVFAVVLGIVLKEEVENSSFLMIFLVSMLAGGIDGFVIALLSRWPRKKLEESNMRVILWRREITLDYRFQVVICSLLIAYLLTAILGHILSPVLAKDPLAVWTSVYASWGAAVVFFTLVGFVVAAVSFRSAHDALFDERVRILFRRVEPVSVLAYNAKRLKKLGCYAVRAKRVMIIREYSDDCKAYYGAPLLISFSR